MTDKTNSTAPLLWPLWIKQNEGGLHISELKLPTEDRIVCENEFFLINPFEASGKDIDEIKKPLK